MKKKFNLLITEKSFLENHHYSLLKPYFNIKTNFSSLRELKLYLKQTDFLHVRFKYKISKNFLLNAKKLICVSSPSTGKNHIDIEFLKQNKITFINLRNHKKEMNKIKSTAELTIGLVLALLRRIPESFDHVKNGGWNRESFIGNDLNNKTLGIIGYGRLGKFVEKIARSFGMRVIKNDIKNIKNNIKLEELIQRSDIITIHVDYNINNKNFFTEKHFNLMKNNSYFINTSRGELVNQSALINGLKEKKIAGAAIDVVDDEFTLTSSSNKDLFKYAKKNSNLLITPHIGGLTEESISLSETIIFKSLIKIVKKLNE